MTDSLVYKNEKEEDVVVEAPQNYEQQIRKEIDRIYELAQENFEQQENSKNDSLALRAMKTRAKILEPIYES